nr:tape measure protein [uncultured Acidovorax sp.]
MADPKIKYDIEAAVKGEADAEALAKTLRGVADVLEGDLQQGALAAAQSLEALGSKQRAIENFGVLKRETTDLETALTKATAQVDRLGNELPQAAANTQQLSAAERTAAAALEQARTSLQSKRDALKAVREETQGAARRTDEYKATVAGLKEGIKAATAEVSAQQQALRNTAQATAQAQNAEAALRKEYDLAIGSSVRLSTELGNKRRALSETREIMQAVGISTTNLTQSEASLKAAVAQVRQEVASMAPAYQQAAAASNQSTQAQAQNQRTLREGMTSISSQLQRIQQIATVALGGSYAGGLAKSVADTADEFKNLEARIKLATGEGPQFQAAFAGVTKVALDTNSALDETGTLFARLAKAGKDAGQSAQVAQENALGLTRTINQAIQLSGGSADAAKAAITQLIQGLQSGVLRGEEFNSVMEQAPRLAQALANGLGVTTEQLRKMAEQGALTADTVMKSLQGQADVVAGEFSKLPPTVGRALQNLTTQWTLYVGESDKGLISSANAAKVIDALAKNLDTVVSTLTAAGKAWAAIKIAGLVADFSRWATQMLTATTALEANTAAAVRNTAAQQANSAAQLQGAAAQAANTAATTANTAARAANATAWAEMGAFTRAAGAAQDAATAATARSTAALAANATTAASAGLVWRGASALVGPWGIALAALTPEILGLTRSLGESIAKAAGWGKVLEENERKLRAQDGALKDHQAALARQNALYDEARNRSFDLTKQSTGLIAEFDKLTKSGESSADALSKIGKDFNASNSEGIRAMSAALEKLLADGKITATEFQAAWAKALDGKDLAVFEVNARNAFAAVGQEAEKLQQQLNQAIQNGASEEVVRDLRKRLEGALASASREGERVANMMDQVVRAAVQRTGLDFDSLQGKIGAASRSAINDLDAVVGGLDRLKAQGVDTGRVLEASLSKAIDTADGQKAIDEVRSRIEQLRKELGNKVADGLLDQAREKALELGDALDKAKPGINSLREAMKALGVTSDETLKNTAAQAKAAYDTIASSGKASARELSEGFAKAAEAAIAANKGIAPSWVQAQAAARGYTLEVDAAGKTTVRSMADAKAAVGGVATAVRDASDLLRQMGIDADTASDKVKALAAGGQALAAAFQYRADQRAADTDKSKFMNQGTISSQDLVPTFNSMAEAEAWKAKWLEQYNKENNNVFRQGGQLGSFMKDLTLFEYNAEVKALEIRKAMEDAKKKAEEEANPPGSGGGGNGGGGSGGGSGNGGPRIDRIVNVYIGNSRAYPVPTNQAGEYSIQDIAREVVRLLEADKRAAGL